MVSLPALGAGVPQNAVGGLPAAGCYCQSV